MFKCNYFLCIYKNIVRIPKDFVEKSNFIYEFKLIFENLSENNSRNEVIDVKNKLNINLLFNSIINSNINRYSPYDSALFFYSLELAYQKGQKVNIRNDGLYIKARELLLRDMVRYRHELIPYFYDKLASVRDNAGLAFYITNINSNSIENTNPTFLCDIIIKLAKTFKYSKSTAILTSSLNSDFFKKTITSLVNLTKSLNHIEIANHFNPQNTFKIVFGLAKLDYSTDDSTKLLQNLISIVIRHLEDERCVWNSKAILMIAWAYNRFEIIDKNLFYKIASLLLKLIDDYDCKEIGLIQDIYTRDEIWNEKLLKLTKSRLHTFVKYGAYSGHVYKHNKLNR